MAQLSTLDLAERKTSVMLNVAEDIVAKIIRHKWKTMNEATYLYTTVEDSGLGKYSIRDWKVARRIQRLGHIIEKSTARVLAGDLSEKELKRYESIIRVAKEEVEYLETKL